MLLVLCQYCGDRSHLALMSERERNRRSCRSELFHLIPVQVDPCDRPRE
jgi:hypothetical protein